MSVLQCNCKHPYQDATYGKGMRVHNRTKKETERCTVCGSEKGNPVTTKPGKTKS